MPDAYLIAVDGHLVGRRFPLDAPCLVGRGPYNHVVLDDTRISRQHAKVSPEAGGYVVYDLNSANGTYVNEAPVKRQKLEPNDVVRFGPFAFRFEAMPTNVERGLRNDLPHKFLEVNTLVGQEPAPAIVDSLDVSSSSPGFLPVGLIELEDAERKLRTLYQLMNALASTLDAEELLERMLRNLLEIFPQAEIVMVYVRDPTSGSMVPRKVLARDAQPVAAYTLAGQFEQEVIGRGRALLSRPTGFQPVQRPGRKTLTQGLAMHAPMIFGEAAHGVLHVRGREGGEHGFTQPDLDLLSSVAAQSAMALHNARLHQESLKQQRLQRDLQLAEQIQKSFLPQQLPAVSGIEFVAEYRPAYLVGGDFYDVFWLDHERLGVFIGDVSGKGVSAALLMARISSDLRVAALAERDPAAALRRVNRTVLDRRQHDIFVTGVYLTLDVNTHEVVIANAGHVPPYVRRAGQGMLERMDQGAGTPIGAFEEAEYEPVRFTLDVGDTMVLTTDGVLEATSSRNEQFGFQRMEVAIGQGSSRAHEVAQRLLRDVRQHVGDASPYDDLTLITFGIVESSYKMQQMNPDSTDNYNALTLSEDDLQKR